MPQQANPALTWLECVSPEQRVTLYRILMQVASWDEEDESQEKGPYSTATSEAQEHPSWRAFDDGRRRGYCIVPGEPGTKKPLVKWKQYQTSKPSDAEVSTWKQQFLSINPIMLTGAISGLVVVDCDGPLGYITIGKRGKFPDTVTVKTPRGDFHEHYWFRYPHNLGTIHNFAGGYDHDLQSVDLRADGGMAVYQGGTNAEGRVYAFKEYHSPDDVEIAPLPAWLYDYIAEHNQKLAAQETERLERLAEAERRRENSMVRVHLSGSTKSSYEYRMERYAAAARRSQIAKVEQAIAGERNIQLFKSAAALAAFINEGVWSEADIENDLTRAAIVCGLDRDPDCGRAGIQGTIHSGIRHGITERIVLPDRPSTRSQYRRHTKIAVEVGL